MSARSVSLGTVLAVAFFAVVVLVRTTQPLLDGDVWWHLRAGETTILERAVPTENTWTVAGYGYPWISQDWLSNVLMATIHNAGELGPTLLSLTFAAIVVLAFLLLWDAVRRRHAGATTVGRVLCLGAGLIVAAPVLGVRVQSIDVLWIATTVWLLWGYLANQRTRWLVALPLLAVAWANTHAAWPLLFALGGGVLVGEGLDRALQRRIRDKPPLSWPQLRNLAVALAISLPALLLNPNGARLLTYPFTTASIQAHRDFLYEWSPPDLGTFPGQVLVGFLVLVVLPTLVLGFRRLRTADLLWLAGLGILSLTAIRFVIAIGPVGGALAAVALAPSLADRLGGGARAVTRLDRPSGGRGQGRLNLAVCAVIALIGIGVAAAKVLPVPQERAIGEAMPVRATDWLSERLADGRIFNVYAWGGYLGREMPDSLPYIDGRSDIYGDAIIREYAEAITLERDPFELLDRETIDAVIFWPDTPLANALDENTAWERVYTDEQAEIWFRSDRQ